MKYYVFFDGLFSTGQTQLSNDQAAPEGSVAVSAELFGKSLKRDAAGKVFARPDAEVLAETAALETKNLRAVGIAAVNARCESLLTSLRLGYPESEVLTWTQQAIDAKAYASNASLPVTMLAALAQARGISLPVLSAKVTAKAKTYAAASGAVIGNRQRLEDLIAAAGSVTALRAIDIESGWLDI